MKYQEEKLKSYLLENQYVEEKHDVVFCRIFRYDKISLEISVVFCNSFAQLTIYELGNNMSDHPRYTGRQRECVEQIAVDYDEWKEDFAKVNQDWESIKIHGCKFRESKMQTDWTLSDSLTAQTWFAPAGGTSGGVTFSSISGSISGLIYGPMRSL